MKQKYSCTLRDTQDNLVGVNTVEEGVDKERWSLNSKYCNAKGYDLTKRKDVEYNTWLEFTREDGLYPMQIKVSKDADGQFYGVAVRFSKGLSFPTSVVTVIKDYLVACGQNCGKRQTVHILFFFPFFSFFFAHSQKKTIGEQDCISQGTKEEVHRRARKRRETSKDHDGTPLKEEKNHSTQFLLKIFLIC